MMVNFGSSFLVGEIRERSSVAWDHISEWAENNGLGSQSDEVREYRRSYFRDNHPGFADVTDVADHIDHAVQVAGIDHVGLGSDFDGVGDSLPTGLKDVSAYPNLLRVLLERGYSAADIEKICSGNVLRVMNEVAIIASELDSR